MIQVSSTAKNTTDLFIRGFESLTSCLHASVPTTSANDIWITLVPVS